MRISDEIVIIDNFCPNFQQMIDIAKKAKYKDINYDGTIFPGISIFEDKWVKHMLMPFYGDVDIKINFLRRYSQGMMQPTFIHTDEDKFDYSGILCLGPDLTKDYGWVAFWKPKNLVRDPFDEKDWILEDKIKLIPNRCIIFPSDMYHSRYPKEWNKKYPRDIQVFFLNKMGGEDEV